MATDWLQWKKEKRKNILFQDSKTGKISDGINGVIIGSVSRLGPTEFHSEKARSQLELCE